ncbi:MAG: hypothetical protein G01um10148_933 [Parcubacteria group bacterium Gr01-1014_8]|nr:MAG: hypothetical protein G01um10148_933 [Parcubacteria group bacterium Gr01-1014_8]
MTDHQRTPQDIGKSIRKAREELEQVLQKEGNAHGGLFIDQKVTKWLENMRTKHANFEKVKAYHIMDRRGPPPDALIDDFSGEDSVLKFFDKILEDDRSSRKP